MRTEANNPPQLLTESKVLKKTIKSDKVKSNMRNVSDYLNQGEKIIWKGTPRFTPYLLESLIPPLIIGVPFLLVVLFLNYLVYSTGAFIGFFITVPMVALSLFIFFWGPFLIISKKGIPVYHITSNKRVIILAELGGLETPFKPYVAIFSKDSVRNTLITQSVFERFFGANIKTIHFKLGFPVKRKYKIIGSYEKGSIDDTNLGKILDASEIGLSPRVSVVVPKRYTEQETIAFSHGGKYARDIAFHSVEKPEEILALIQGN